MNLSITEISAVLAFVSGLLTFFAPCTFVTLPAFLTYLASHSIQTTPQNSKKYRMHIFLAALVYVVGFLLVFTILGMSSTAFGEILAKNRELFERIGGVMIVLFGLLVIFGEKFRSFSFIYRERKFRFDSQNVRKGYIFPFLIGVTSAFAWTPCIGPVLGGILLLAGATSENIYQGGLLLFLYGLGVMIPFLVISLFIGQAASFVKKYSKFTGILNKITGILLLLIGFMLLTGYYDQLFGLLNQLFVSFGYTPK